MENVFKIRRYTFTYKRFFKVDDIEIRAFSLKRAVEKFYVIFPKCKIVSIDEVEE